MSGTRDDGGEQVAGFVAKLDLNLDRIDAGLVTWEGFEARQRVIWDEIAAAGPVVHASVLAAMRGDRAGAR